ncbi:hypothetical protein FHT44_006116 [Mycolicibacterium sp. BK634]|uniref:hypothetical protein n=1 Tax=Mycolicibacterium sp. BK634 TaxID=2587099 RepID=UPI001051BE30|nr:hypothetical protein [Mycolicibacterium sp. BK634]MBB3753594.1 hypothetical protein [Mycolicibacterium sp. BK634]
MTIHYSGQPRVCTVPGGAAGGRVLLGLVGAAGFVTLAFTAVFLVATAAEQSSPPEVLGVIAG